MSGLDLAADLQGQGVDTWLIDAINGLARTTPGALEAHLRAIGEASSLAGTQATCRYHCVVVDPNGQARVPHLVQMLARQIVDYCIPRSRINEAVAAFSRTRSTEELLRLQAEARALFTELKLSGEGGELLLYALLELGLGIPQVLCKMPLKTNANMHIHGTDGLHARALPNGNLAVYWGEAKLYATANGAIDAAIASLAPFLHSGGLGPAERDILLMRDHADTGDPALTTALVRYFTEGTMESSGVEFRGACLVGFDYPHYGTTFNDVPDNVQKEVSEAIATWQARVARVIENEKLVSFNIEVFCVPLPSVQQFRDLIKTHLGLRA
jgi:hypothetical protein